MTTSIKGPALFLAQFLGDEAPFNSLPAIVQWAAGHGYKGVQIPSWDARVFDLDKAASSQDYCDEIIETCAQHGVTI
ncbi:MAG: sugar phosphate isomerase/epimerase, partial [Octadecabacter sp.]|nr:sugar phosphate isomerase/epimerase [Octadecabacter sp.]